MVGRQLPFFSVIVPFWVVWAITGFRGMLACGRPTLPAASLRGAAVSRLELSTGRGWSTSWPSWSRWRALASCCASGIREDLGQRSLKGTRRNASLAAAAQAVDPASDNAGLDAESGVDAVDHAERLRVHVGPAAVKKVARRNLGRQDSRCRDCTTSCAGPAGRRQARRRKQRYSR